MNPDNQQKASQTEEVLCGEKMSEGFKTCRLDGVQEKLRASEWVRTLLKVKRKVKPLDNKQLCVLIFTLALLGSSRASPMTDPPLLPNQHFLFTWNAPTELCERHFKLPLDLSNWHFVTSTLGEVTNQSITLFYTSRFGIYPDIDKKTHHTVNGGVPQNVDMQLHEEKAEKDINRYIPENQIGLAIIDFEEWRPLWVRNWGSMKRYQAMSIDIVKAKNPTLSDGEAEAQAEIEYEAAAKEYFLRCLRLGKRLRPKTLWGFYLFPDCYNTHYNREGVANFDGKCPAREYTRNDMLLWLWKESTALYPSIYIEKVLGNLYQARLYVRYRIQEAVRVSMLPNGDYSTPIYAYIHPRYKHEDNLYTTELDLVNTIGEAASLGIAGVISWGGMEAVRTQEACLDSQRHLDIMNPYMLNVSTAANLCSAAICQGRGRCRRKRWDEDVFLHLDPRRYEIRRRDGVGPFAVTGSLSQEDIDWFGRHFDCMCYGEQPCRSLLQLSHADEQRAADQRLLLLGMTFLSLMCGPL